MRPQRDFPPPPPLGLWLYLVGAYAALGIFYVALALAEQIPS